MRCLILIALCLALANASYYNNRNRFHKLLNRYQRGSPMMMRGEYGNEYAPFGSDDVDDYIDDYVEEIRRERMFDRDQCPRDIEDILGMENEESMMNTFDNEDEEEMMTGRRHHRGRFTDTDDEESMMTEEGARYFGGDEDASERGTPLLKEIKNANIKLTTRLYEQCKQERDDKNTVVSPLSVQLALAALNAGARGNTKRQLGRVIGGNLKTQERKQIVKTLIRHLKGFRNIEYSTDQPQHTTKINTVTGLFVSKTTRAQQMFTQRVKTTMGATVKHCSFSHQPQQCRRSINEWMAQKTHRKINQIVPQDAITDNTKMVLVNGLELKATWGPQMRRHITKEAKFYPLDSKKVKIVEVMETEGRFKYYEDELVKIVGVPTKQQEMTLYAIVPKDKDGLTEVEKIHLQDNIQLKQLLEKTDKHTRRVHVQLPKFQIKHKIDVRRTLRKQGVTDAFDPLRADFSGITGASTYEHEYYGQEETTTMYGRNPFSVYEEDNTMRQGRETKLHLNKFIHQCTIKITENGITAATGNQADEDYERFGRMGGMESEEEMMEQFSGLFRRGEFEPTMSTGTGEHVIKANRAFAFVLKHNPTKQVVMVGRVIDAAQKKINHVPQTINGVDQF
jgi:serpin B